MSDTSTGAARPSITDAELHAAVHDLAFAAFSTSKALRRDGERLIAQADALDRWRDRHGAATAHVLDELREASDFEARPKVDVHVRLDTSRFVAGIERAQQALRDMQRGPSTADDLRRVARAGSAEDPSCFTTRAATPPTIDDVPGVRFVGGLPFTDSERAVFLPVMPFPGALPLTDDLAEVLTRLDAIGDDGVPCPEMMHADGPCEWCDGWTGRVPLATLTRYIAETGHVDRARAVLGLRPLATVPA